MTFPTLTVPPRNAPLGGLLWAKSWANSRVFWVNAAVAVVAILQTTDVARIIPARWQSQIAALVATINIVLRFATTQPIALIAPGKQEPVAPTVQLNG